MYESIYCERHLWLLFSVMVGQKREYIYINISTLNWTTNNKFLSIVLSEHSTLVRFSERHPWLSSVMVGKLVNNPFANKVGEREWLAHNISTFYITRPILPLDLTIGVYIFCKILRWRKIKGGKWLCLWGNLRLGALDFVFGQNLFQIDGGMGGR